VTDDERDLFRRALADAKPLRTTRRAAEVIRKPAPRARFSRADDASVLRESLEAHIDDTESHSGDSLRFHRPSVGKRTLRKLARGNFSVQDEIDLHGMTVAKAKPRLAEFIECCAREGRLCVRIVHGKGLGSGERGPVLKQKVNRWLRQWDTVLAFVSTRQVHGGTGALYVLLRQS
jgi:DNA-nicking Smr family endonuclease